MRIILTATVLLLLSSCSTYRTFKTPDISSENICGENITVQDTLVDIPSWKEMFTDQQLQQLIEKGIKSNTDLQIAHLNIEQAEALLRSSKLAYLPSFAFSPEGSVSKFNGSKASYTYNLSLTTQWELDISGRLRNSKEQARSSVLISQEYTKMVQTQLIASITNSYYTLVMLDEQLRITKESIINQKESLEVITELKSAGMQTEAAVNQATADYYNVLASAKDLEKQIYIVENSIALLINEAPHTIEHSLFANTDVLNVELSNNISLISLANRPDVREAEYALRNNFYGINVARAAFYPSISLSGSAGWTNNIGAIVNPGNLLSSALGSLTQPIFNRGVNKANFKIAEAQYEQSLLSFHKAILIAGNEVNSALTECQSSDEKRMFRQMQVLANKRALENSMELMKHSSTTYLEVLIAQNSLLQSKLVQVSDWFEGVQGRINLYKALGGGVY
ncbi:MAG: TolC family protein [Labilibaculum sp.]|nr:TolC family protein [Labilibaculum sp.]